MHDVHQRACLRRNLNLDVGDHYGIMGGWMAVFERTSGDVFTGTCAYFRATRSRAQMTLWQSFSQYARRVTSLPHFPDPDPNHVTPRYPDDSVGCGLSKVCVAWLEFDSSSYTCTPETRKFDSFLGNVLSPQRILDLAEKYGVGLPPPSPPPIVPHPPPPPSPPYAATPCSLPALHAKLRHTSRFDFVVAQADAFV